MAHSRRELGRLDRRYSLCAWPLPQRVQVSSDGRWLEWRYPRGPGAERLATRRDPSSELLRGFIGLADTAASQIEKFALRWGVLHHRGKAGPGERGRDNLQRWFQTIQGFRGVLGLSDALRTGGIPGIHDLRLAMRLFPRGQRDPYLELVWARCTSLLSPTPGRRRTAAAMERGQRIETARHALKIVTQSALQAAHTTPCVILDAGSPNGFCLEIGGGSFKAALATALLYAVIGSERGPAFCDGCGRAHQPRRRSSVGRRSFCDVCRQQGVDNRVRVRDHRAYRRSLRL